MLVFGVSMALNRYASRATVKRLKRRKNIARGTKHWPAI